MISFSTKSTADVKTFSIGNVVVSSEVVKAVGISVEIFVAVFRRGLDNNPFWKMNFPQKLKGLISYLKFIVSLLDIGNFVDVSIFLETAFDPF